GGFGGAIAAQQDGLLGSAAPSVTIDQCSFTGNQALGLAAAPGADASGQCSGGAIDLEVGAKGTVDHSTFAGSLARGGDGGDGGPGGDGGAGGASFGGAIFNNSATLSVDHSRFTGNEVRGGDGGRGGAGGDGGLGGAFSLGGAIASTFSTSISL